MVQAALPTSNLVQINSLFEQTESTISFWGRREIVLKKTDETVPLHLVAARFLELASLDSLSHEERVAGIKLIDKLRNYYTDTDEVIALSNSWISYFLNWFREKIIDTLTGRTWWNIRHDLFEGDVAVRLRTFTEPQFIAAFPGKPLPINKTSLDNKELYLVEF